MSARPASTLRFSVQRRTRASQVALVVSLVALIVLTSLPFWGEQSSMMTLVELFYFIALAQMWNVLAGYGGMLSIGQQAYVGLGAYALVVLTTQFHVQPFLAVLLAAPVAGAIGWCATRILFRLQGPYFAIGTWVFAEVLRLLFANFSRFGGGSGISITDQVRGMDPWWRNAGTYWMALAVGFGTVALVYFLLRRRYGLGLTAVRDSEAASESLGLSVRRAKTWTYVFVALCTGAIGALIFLTKLRVSPDSAFDVNWSALMIFIVVIGGVGTIEGPLVGVLVYFVLRNYLSDYGAWYMLLLGLLAIATILFLRGGIWGWISRKFDLCLFPVQRRLRIDSVDEMSDQGEATP